MEFVHRVKLVYNIFISYHIGVVVLKSQPAQYARKYVKQFHKRMYTKYVILGTCLSFISILYYSKSSSSPVKVLDYWFYKYLPNYPKPNLAHVNYDFPVSSTQFSTDQLSRSADEARIEHLQEALTTLRAALEFNAQGKCDKAYRLLAHALALAPKHPEILTRYGEYMEHSRRDVVTADSMYFQALVENPKHNEALANRLRTAAIVQNIDQQRLDKLDEKRDALSAIHESSAALRRAKKEAYVQHIYHSCGIEGNSMTLAQTRSVLETRMAVAGKTIDEHNEILGLDAALKYINASLVKKMEFITSADIMEIHKRVLGHVDPIEGGELRRTQVYVGGHIPPGPDDLHILMFRFEQWLNSEQALSMHPVKYAALAHYKLVHIHPFADGNGRTSRLLMNTILMRNGYPPVIIPKQQRYRYYDYLQRANEGDIRPFIRFIADCTDKTLDLYLWASSELSHHIPLLAQTEHTKNSGKSSVEEEHINYNDQDTTGDTIRLGGYVYDDVDRIDS